jgi:hypothetical protein
MLGALYYDVGYILSVSRLRSTLSTAAVDKEQIEKEPAPARLRKSRRSRDQVRR